MKEVDSKHMKRNLSESIKESGACNEGRLVWTSQISAKDSNVKTPDTASPADAAQ